MICFAVPIDPRGGLNAREHWRQRDRRVRGERNAVAAYAPLPWQWRELRKEAERFNVTLTRVAPRKLDDDNWVGRAKGVRDEVARLLGIDDGDERLTWQYRQERGKPREKSVLVLVEPLP